MKTKPSPLWLGQLSQQCIIRMAFVDFIDGPIAFVRVNEIPNETLNNLLAFEIESNPAINNIRITHSDLTPSSLPLHRKGMLAVFVNSDK